MGKMILVGHSPQEKKGATTMKNIFTYITTAILFAYCNFAGLIWLAGYDSIEQFINLTC